MSIRLHVVAALGASEGDFKTALDSIGDDGNGSQRFRVGSSGKWMWACASVWQVGGGEIDDALSSLSVPALRVTSSDAVLWMLTLTAPGRDRFHGVHYFTQVGDEPPQLQPGEGSRDEDFPEDELEEVAGINRFIPELKFLWDAEEEARLKQAYAEEAAEDVEGLDDYADYGVVLSDVVIDQMRRYPHSARYTAFMAHGRQIVEALDDFGFEFDPAAMLKMLTDGPLTDLEHHSEIGNMPRFLRAIGIDGVFQEERESREGLPDHERDRKYMEDHEDRLTGDVDWSEYPPGDLFAKVSSVLATCPLEDLSGEPIKVGSIPRLHLLSHLLSDNPTASVAITFPGDNCLPTSAWESLDDLEVSQDGPDWRFTFSTRLWWLGAEDREDLEQNELAQALNTVPDGARVELSFLVDGLAEGCHRYAGILHGGTLELDRLYPTLPAELLPRVLELVDQTFDKTSIALESEEEEALVRHNYQRSQGVTAKIRNRKIMPQEGGRSVVIQTLLFERFEEASPWDVVGARRLVEEGWVLYDQVVNPPDDGDDEADEPLTEAEAAELARFDETMQQMSDAVEQFREAQKVPHRDEVIYEGRTGKFLSAAMSDLQHVSAEKLDEHDATMTMLGFRCLGDFVGDADQRQEISRCYVARQALALYGHRNENNQFGWADISNGAVLVDFSQGTVEFHTHFEDGTTLVTTSIDATHSKPEAGIYVRAYEDVAATKLWEKHLDGIDRFQEHRSTVPLDHTVFSEPARLLAKMDELLGRFMGLE